MVANIRVDRVEWCGDLTNGVRKLGHCETPARLRTTAASHARVDCKAHFAMAIAHGHPVEDYVVESVQPQVVLKPFTVFAHRFKRVDLAFRTCCIRSDQRE